MRTVARTSVALALAVGLPSLLLSGAIPVGLGGRAQPGVAPHQATRSAQHTDEAAQREAFLEMFARGYFPGRSGQIMIVPRRGTVITRRDPFYLFMHGSPWAYDTDVPLVLYGPGFVRRYVGEQPVRQQDLVPTLAGLLKIAPPSTSTGRALIEALVPSPPSPSIVAVVALDGMRADYLDRYATSMPTLTRLRESGASFRVQIDYLPTQTSSGHATLGTGTDPNIHGIAANNFYDHSAGAARAVYHQLDPSELMALTLADHWNIASNGRAHIVAMGGAIRASIGLVGHGGCLVGARPVVMVSYSARLGGWETNPECYVLPAYLQDHQAKRSWEAVGGRWMGHDVSNPSAFQYSALFQRFEGEALLRLIEGHPMGDDDITDLLLVNLKSPDYVAHTYGPHSAELRATLAELDRQLSTAVRALERKAATRLVLAISADHGMPGEPPAGERRYVEDIVDLLHAEFDPAGKLVVYYRDPANGQIYVSRPRLRELELSLSDLARFLEAQPFIFAAYTEDEVRAATASVRR